MESIYKGISPSVGIFPIVMALIVLSLGCGGNPSSAGKSQAAIGNPFEHIQDLEVQKHLQKAIAAAGGLETWQNCDQIHFDKHTVLYDEKGMIESDRRQQIIWKKRPETEVNITWLEGVVTHQIMSNSGRTKKLEDQIDVTPTDLTSLTNGILSATYVMAIPFKLLDHQYELMYQGIDTLESQEVVHVLQSRYLDRDKSEEDIDTWWHYYDVDSYQQLGYKVKHADHISLIENLDMTRSGGILWPTQRKSWRIDDFGQKDYLRADYTYANYQIE